jgi:hypothetical protein
MQRSSEERYCDISVNNTPGFDLACIAIRPNRLKHMMAIAKFCHVDDLLQCLCPAIMWPVYLWPMVACAAVTCVAEQDLVAQQVSRPVAARQGLGRGTPLPRDFYLETPEERWAGSFFCDPGDNLAGIKKRLSWFVRSSRSGLVRPGAIDLGEDVLDVVGLPGMGIALLIQGEKFDAVEWLDVFQDPPLRRHVMNLESGAQIMDLHFHRKECALYWFEGGLGRIGRISVKQTFPLEVFDDAISIFAMVPEWLRDASPVSIVTELWPDLPTEGMNGVYLRLSGKASRNTGENWRVNYRNGALSVAPIENDEWGHPVSECWQIAPGDPGGFSVNVSGCIAGKLRVNTVVPKGKDLELSYAGDGSPVAVALSGYPSWFGHWVQVAGEGLSISRPLFLDCSWTSGLGSGGVVVKSTYVAHHVANPGQDCLPIVVDCRWWPQRKTKDWRWVIMAELIDAAGQLAIRGEPPSFGRGVAVQSLVIKREKPEDLIAGIAFPETARLGDLCIWQVHGFWEQDGQQEYWGSTLLHAFPVVEKPKARIGYRPVTPLRIVEVARPDPEEAARWLGRLPR